MTGRGYAFLLSLAVALSACRTPPPPPRAPESGLADSTLHTAFDAYRPV